MLRLGEHTLTGRANSNGALLRGFPELEQMKSKFGGK